MPPSVNFIPNIKCGPCIYCHEITESKPEEFLECEICRGSAHIKCLKSGIPSSRLLGDNFFIFKCAQCSFKNCDSVVRANMSVPQMLLLVFYNLHCTREDESVDGFFHYKKHVHDFIMGKWKELFNYNGKASYKDKKKLKASCISGQLTHSHYFVQKKIGRGGWYRLITIASPTRIIHGLKKGVLSNEFLLKDESKKLKVNDSVSKSSSNSFLNNCLSNVLIKEEIPEEATAENKEDSSSRGSWFTDRDVIRVAEKVPTRFLEDDDELDVVKVKEVPLVGDFIMTVMGVKPEPFSTPEMVVKEEEQPPPPPPPALISSLFSTSKNLPDAKSASNKKKCERIMPLSVYEERKLLKQLDQLNDTCELNPEFYRLRRKLKVRKIKREHGLPVFNIDDEMRFLNKRQRLMSKAEKSSKTRYDSCFPLNEQSRILDRFQVGSDRCSQTARSEPTSFRIRLVGAPHLELIHSPYSLRKLKPYILRDYSVTPLKLKLLQEIVRYPHRKEKDFKVSPRYPIDYCYVTHKHIPAMNQLARQFFWPGIELSEVLQYPDFSCVVLYGHLVIGFGVIVPDTNPNEAYVSFLLVHPEWRRSGIAKFILYHLIQTCSGKDITLHVSATNPALIMYQQFGFKVEEFLTDFYDKYLPEESPECKHAMFLRLSR